LDESLGREALLDWQRIDTMKLSLDEFVITIQVDAFPELMLLTSFLDVLDAT